MYERITPPKIVPWALVSFGISTTRIDGSFRSGRIGELIRFSCTSQGRVERRIFGGPKSVEARAT
jgi:hypothetical protein